MSERIGVRYINDKEVWIGENKTTLRDDSIIHVIAVGPQNIEIATAQLEVNKRLARQVEGKVNYLIDLNRAGKSTPEVRKMWKEISDQEGTCRVALIGFHPVARVLAAFVMSVTSSQNVRFFKTKAEGLAWLKS